jgi:hypothetical protein
VVRERNFGAGQIGLRRGLIPMIDDAYQVGKTKTRSWVPECDLNKERYGMAPRVAW